MRRKKEYSQEWTDGDYWFKVNINTSTQYGNFEINNEKTDFYAEGGLWFHENVLVDYDGVHEMNPKILDKIESWRFDVSEVRSCQDWKEDKY